jgi:broad specificity phosphatase PhoE
VAAAEDPRPAWRETDTQVAARVTHALMGGGAVDGGGIRLVVAHAGLLRGLLASNGMADEEVAPLGGRWLTVLPGRRALVIGERASL